MGENIEENAAEKRVRLALLANGWAATPLTPAPNRVPITQAKVREVMYSKYAEMCERKAPYAILTTRREIDIVYSCLMHEEKSRIGPGISLLVLSGNVYNMKTPGFFVARTDGLVVDFAIKWCFIHGKVPRGDDSAFKPLKNRLLAQGLLAES